MGSMSIWHWIVVLVVVLLLFGRGKISDLMGDVAKGIKSFKKGMAEDDTTPPGQTPAAPEAPRNIPHQTTTAPEGEKKPV
ncbi:twin-arginine translocase TatA/TatE family subunit [Aquabacter sp. L1I39]|uniref:twin-arginine translocase TatA/TatE family subunit n=1 Tax=Aquabacter sp. L1I39 TaxID=2820278 RepID=UPI001ADBB557|nr:twin-arginine translocase TatA/TatE family subunit [Aquabacter sp. L1I39]QTL02640.1 twin-arginine translocase TatA/TatE family subunit [Aquabacter sp. L1I39]